MTDRSTPTLTQRIRYITGGTLPTSMSGRVITAALVYVYRRAGLARHGLDPVLADQCERRRGAAAREVYERRHGRG